MGAVVQYLCDLGAAETDAKINRTHLENAYQQIALYETQLMKPLIEFLNQHENIQIIGLNHSETNQRVATLSFVHDKTDSKTIVEQVDPHNIGIRFGDFYAVELINNLALRNQNGVVRISLAHYNTSDEIKMLINALNKIINN